MYSGRAAWTLFWHVKCVMWGPRFLLLHALVLSLVLPGARLILQQQPRSIGFSLSSPLHSFLLCLAQRLYCCNILVRLAAAIEHSFSRLTASPPHAPLTPNNIHQEAAAMVYITSDLFGPADTQNQSPHHWHIMTDSQHDVSGLGKRKRVHDGDAAHSTRGSRLQHASALNHNSDRSYATSEQRPMKQIKRVVPKLAFAKSTSHLMDTDIGTSPPVGGANGQVQPHAVNDLRACHACKSAPKRKSDLENYMDCKRCIGRTCYICARQCLGGCGRKVCRECTAEVGQERDSWCLDCLQREQYMR